MRRVLAVGLVVAAAVVVGLAGAGDAALGGAQLTVTTFGTIAHRHVLALVFLLAAAVLGTDVAIVAVLELGDLAATFLRDALDLQVADVPTLAQVVLRAVDAFTRLGVAGVDGTRDFVVAGLGCVLTLVDLLQADSLRRALVAVRAIGFDLAAVHLRRVLALVGVLVAGERDAGVTLVAVRWREAAALLLVGLTAGVERALFRRARVPIVGA